MKLRNFLPFFLFLIPLFVHAQAPVNDECATAINLGNAPTLGFCSTVYSNVDATLSQISTLPEENQPTCYTSIDRDVWFSFDVPVGSLLVDFELTLEGVGGAALSILNPQISVYVGDCGVNNLIENYCFQAPFNTNTAAIELTGLNPGQTYYIRVSDFSATAAPASGDFTICVDEFDPIFIMGEDESTTLCEGVLYDSGGPETGGVYGNQENNSFTICPTSSFSCLIVTLESYATETNLDDINFIAGPTVGGPQIASFSGVGGPIEIQNDGCITVQFTTDGSVTNEGFVINWSCSNSVCTAPPILSCEEPVLVPNLPYTIEDFNTVTTGNAITDNNSPCADDFFLSGNDAIFAYTSPGEECIKILVDGTTQGTGIAIFLDCPYTDGQCVNVQQTFGNASPEITSVELETAGTYYIVVAAPNTSTVFDILIDTAECILQLPSAGYCSDALSVNGCPDDVPSVLQVADGSGDPDWNQGGVNNGCLGTPQQNYTFLFFQAQVDGTLAFTLEAANVTTEDSDIDFNIWGPLDSASQLCEFGLNNQPIRSSYAGGADPTGLQSIHPVTGLEVTDELDCFDFGGNTDDFVTPLPVIQGKWYLMLIDDFGSAVELGGISADFSNTDSDVLGSLVAVTVSSDTAICVGTAVSLFATGGENYLWTPNTNIDCTTCDTVLVSPTQTTVYTVNILTTCSQIVEEVKVEFLQLIPTADVTACQGQQLEFNVGPEFGTANYTWTSSSTEVLENLSCTDCPDPILNTTGLSPGLKTVFVTLSGPGDGCTFVDTFTINVLNAAAPIVTNIVDTTLCIGSTVSLGGTALPGQTYEWSSFPEGLISPDGQITVTPENTTTYFLAVGNASCPFPLLDSATITVEQLPLLSLINSTIVCPNSNLANLNTQAGQPTVVYTWTPNTYLNNPALAQPSATNITEDVTYTVTADRNGCINSDSFTLTLASGSINITNGDSLALCIGDAATLIASGISPAGAQVVWSSIPAGTNAFGSLLNINPNASAIFVATVGSNGCNFRDSIAVGVSIIPLNANILPQDTVLCLGDSLSLSSAAIDFSLYPNLVIDWSTTAGGNFLSPTNAYNAFVNPITPGIFIYTRVLTNGACTVTHTSNVVVSPTVNMTLAPTNIEVCAGVPVPLAITNSNAISYTWEAPAAATLSCLDCATPTLTALQTSVVTVTGVGPQGSCNDVQTVTIVILDPPSISFPTDTDLCLGEGITLNSATPAPGEVYTWSGPGVTPAESNPTVNPEDTATYFITITGAGNCIFNDSITINVADATLTVPSGFTICEGTEALLFATGGNGIDSNYVWSPSDSTGISINVTPTSTTVYTVLYTYGDGCTETETIEVTVADPIEVEIVALPNVTEIAEGTSVLLSTVLTGSGIDTTYTWLGNGLPIFEATPQITVLPLQNPSVYVVNVDAGTGCFATDSIVFGVIAPNFSIPTAFSPNGDNLNELFQIVASNATPVVVTNFQIFNRWGKLVHEGAGISAIWDGKLKGEPQPSDLYNYIIKVRNADSTETLYKGELMLLR